MFPTDTEDCSQLIDPQENIELLMVSSCACYENALEHVSNSFGDNAEEEARHELLRRLGNVRNELGVKYMFWAQEEYTKYVEENKDVVHTNDTTNDSKESLENETDIKSKEESDNEETKVNTKIEEPLYLTLAMKSYDCLIRGIKAFTLVEDKVNLAFLYCNMGRFMRFRAHLIIPNEK